MPPTDEEQQQQLRDAVEQLQGLREAVVIKDEALRYLRQTADWQGERWGLMRRIIEDAGKQYAAMRHDVVEESLRDQGAPIWLSCILTIGVTLIPISLFTASFLTAATRTTQKLLTRADRSLLRVAEAEFAGASDLGSVLAGAHTLIDISNRIKRTEAIVAKFAKNMEPELANRLQDIASTLAETLGKQPFVQDSGRKSKMIRTDAPIVVVTQALQKWVTTQTQVELSARHRLERHLQDLFDIAISPEPRKAARAKETTYEERDIKVIEPLPTTNKDAIHKLKVERDELDSKTIEKPQDIEAENLRDLQLIIESMIWCLTYDFTPRIQPPMYVIGAPGSQKNIMLPAPLPDGLWKRLTERYIDPDERKSYKDVGTISRLGTKDYPTYEAGEWSPDVRLSHYFSMVLYPQLENANFEMIRRFSR